MNAYGTEVRPAHQRPIRHGGRLYLTDVQRGWWEEVPRSCEHCGGRLFVEPPRVTVPGAIVCSLCSRERPEDVFETRLPVVTLTRGEICAGCEQRRILHARRLCHPCYMVWFRAKQRDAAGAGR